MAINDILGTKSEFSLTYVSCYSCLVFLRWSEVQGSEVELQGSRWRAHWATHLETPSHTFALPFMKTNGDSSVEIPLALL